MSRYIDAEWLKAEFPHDEDWNYPVNTNSYVVEMIDDAPSIDIVRCKECKHADVCSQNVAMRETYDIYEKIEYCSYGERKSDE